MIRRVALWVLAIFWIVAGANHFVNPDFYVNIMPPWIPAHLGMVYLSGVLEVVGGIAVLVPATRAIAGSGLVAMLLAFMPIHIHMIRHSEIYVAQGVPYATLWIRLPIQAFFVWWAWWATRPERSR